MSGGLPAGYGSWSMQRSAERKPRRQGKLPSGWPGWWGSGWDWLAEVARFHPAHHAAGGVLLNNMDADHGEDEDNL